MSGETGSNIKLETLSTERARLGPDHEGLEIAEEAEEEEEDAISGDSSSGDDSSGSSDSDASD